MILTDWWKGHDSPDTVDWPGLMHDYGERAMANGVKLHMDEHGSSSVPDWAYQFAYEVFKKQRAGNPMRSHAKPQGRKGRRRNPVVNAEAVQRLARSSVTSAELQRRYARAWNSGKSRQIGLYGAALLVRGEDPNASFNKKWAKLTAIAPGEKLHYFPPAKTRRRNPAGPNDKLLNASNREAIEAQSALRRAARYARISLPADANYAEFARAFPLVTAVAIDDLINRSAKAWEDANNSGNNSIYKRYDEIHQRTGAAVEIIAAVFGIKTDWPGLYPAFNVHGYDDHPSSIGKIERILKEALQPKTRNPRRNPRRRNPDVYARRVYEYPRGHKYAWAAWERGAAWRDVLAWGRTEKAAIAAGKRALARRR